MPIEEGAVLDISEGCEGVGAGVAIYVFEFRSPESGVADDQVTGKMIKFD